MKSGNMNTKTSTLLLFLCIITQSQAFNSPPRPIFISSTAAVHLPHNPTSYHHHATPLQATHSPIFDFSLSNTTLKQKSASSFERIDDAIMGGISTSSLRDIPSKPYASWSGICRIDGGGFCGTRTLPFEIPLNATGYCGIYMDGWLASDEEADRRVWKMTVRTDGSRGEQVYQAQFDLGKAMKDAIKNSSSGMDEKWARVHVPFDDFQLVRGPRLVPDGPKLNVTGGLYQIGMTMSKFKIAVNTTELEDFRPGYFDVHIRQMGFYKDDDNDASSVEAVILPDTLTEEEAAKKRPLVLKMLLPVAKIFFSEQANRRRSAMKLLQQKRSMNRAKAIMFGVRLRRGSMGMIPSIFKTLSILSIDSFRSVIGTALRVGLVYPLRLVGAAVRLVKKALGMKVKVPLRE
jgi:hypothetical protein